MSLERWLDDLGGELRTAAVRPRRPRVPARRMVGPAAAAAVLVAVIALPLGRDDPEVEAIAPSKVRTVAPADILGEIEPYMGVSCPRPNRIGCDRVGLSVWLDRPATAVTAEIGGRRFALDDDEWAGHSGDGYRSAFAGFLQPAGLDDGDGPLRVRADADGRWLGGEPVSAPVTLTITLATGEVVRTTLEVPLAAGWG